MSFNHGIRVEYLKVIHFTIPAPDFEKKTVTHFKNIGKTILYGRGQRER